MPLWTVTRWMWVRPSGRRGSWLVRWRTEAAAADGPVGPLLVLDLAEGVELGLELLRLAAGGWARANLWRVPWNRSTLPGSSGSAFSWWRWSYSEGSLSSGASGLVGLGVVPGEDSLLLPLAISPLPPEGCQQRSSEHRLHRLSPGQSRVQSSMSVNHHRRAIRQPPMGCRPTHQHSLARSAGRCGSCLGAFSGWGG